jgi:hypothetical protein
MRLERPVLALVLLAVAAGPALAQTSPREAQRRKLLEELGLKKTDAKPAPTPTTTPTPTIVEPEAPAPTTSPPGAKPAAAPAGVSFRRGVHPLLMQTCRPCHGAGGPAAMTKLVLTGDAAGDHPVVARLVSAADGAASPLLAKSSGAVLHAGGAPWPEGSAAHGRVLAWIKGGARLDGPPSGPTPPAPPLPRPPGREPTPVATPSATPEPPVTPTEAPAPVASPTDATPAAAPAGVSFPTVVHPLLVQTCRPCHVAGGPAAMTKLVLTGDAAGDQAAVARLVNVGDAAASPLLAKSSGAAPHAGGAPWPPGSPAHDRVLAWIQDGARPTENEPARAEPAPIAAPPAAPAPAAPPPAPAAPPHAAGLQLPAGFALDGRFDLALERRAFSGDPFADGSASALRSYHHFLFLSREGTGDPVGLSVELTSLLFWEAHARWAPASRAFRVTMSGGKILVPFGADPLFHQSYGGHTGFDQRILPVVFAQEGITARVLVERRAAALTNDLYVVRGYALRQATGVLNLQNDLSSADDAHLAVGDRVGLSCGPLSLWYSALFNRLGFGRRLFMQAADVTLWRLRGVPVLDHLSFGAGLFRADVSGGGADLDYYHFGSYAQVRVHATDWLYLQYRQGVRTFDNRRGVWVDRTRLSREDGSTHNFSLVARHGGATATLAWFINLEKAGEVADDLVRLSVAYDF